MAKFANQSIPVQRAPIAATTPTRNYNGGPAWSNDAKGELFLLAATNMVKEDTFYESAARRDNRFVTLIHEVTAADPEWVRRFGPYLRRELKMRSASVVLACEYVRAGGPAGRQLINDVCQRPDEPAEVVGYWISRYGRSLPWAVKRGVADAVARQYTERNLIKYDSARRGFTFTDVIELSHPTPRDEAQSRLFKYILDQGHHSDGNIEGLSTLEEDKAYMGLPEKVRRTSLGDIPESWDWRRLSGWLPGGMDAQAWEAVIPTMGVQALLMNLRNFDGKGISDAAIDIVISKITDQKEVEASRVFPYQVWTAYREAPSDNWKRALGKTLDLTLTNVPQFDGQTLVIVDCSWSMRDTLNDKSTMTRIELAASMGAALALSNKAELCVFAEKNALMDYRPGTAALALTAEVQNLVDDGYHNSPLGGGTYLHSAILQRYKPGIHKRVVVFTDDQAHDSHLDLSQVPTIYTFDLTGYGRNAQKNGSKGRYVFGGYSDAAMSCIGALEHAGHTGWPF